MARRAVVLAIAVLGSLVGSRADATIMVEVTLEDMVRDSVAIVHARVIHTGTQMVMRDDSFDPHTVTTLQVTNWIKGSGGVNVTLRELGGTYGPNGTGGGMWIDGTPRYAPGEEVIVFLRPDPDDSTLFRTYAMSQGKFVVTQGLPGVVATVARDTATVAFATWTSGQMTLSHGGREIMQLDAFLDLVRGVVRIDVGQDSPLGGSR